MNKLSRPIADLKTKNSGGFSYGGITNVAKDMMSVLYATEEKIQKLQEEYADSLREEDNQRNKNHREILRVIVAATRKKARAQKKLERDAKKAEQSKQRQQEKEAKKETKDTQQAKKDEKVEAKKEVETKKSEQKTETDTKKAEVKKETTDKKVEKKAETDQQIKKQESTDKKQVERKSEDIAKRQETKPTAKPVEEVKPPPTAKPEAPKAPSISKVPSIKGNKGLVVGALAGAGLSTAAQANIMSQVESESKFKPESENLNYSSAERIQKVFGKNRFPTVESAQPYVNNPEGLANYVYAKTDGNSEPGDGWKYRGRGFLQHTGKNQYKAIAKYTGVDVLNNPDLLNDPQVAAKAIPWFFLEYKKKKPEQLENINEVNKAVGFSDASSGEKRVQLSKAYLSELNGDNINAKSAENASMRKEMQQNAGTTIVIQENNNTTVNKRPMVMQEKKQELNPTMR